MAETNTAPSPNFSTIDFNPSFFTTSTALTLEEADALYLNKTVADTANVLETFTAGILTNTIQSTTATITSSLEVLGTLTSDSVDSVGTTLTLGSTNATTVTTSKPFTANSYSLTGSVPTLSKSFLSYFVNYASVSEGVTTTGAKYLYTPASNGSTASTNYLNAGVYEANINVYVVQTGGPVFSGCAFTIGVASGTATGAISKASQYGTAIIVPSPSFSVANVGSVNLNGNGCVFSHAGCFTLASSAFINLELFISALTAITNGTVTFSIYGCVKRIA